MIPVWFYFAILPSIIAISVIDWYVLNEWWKCEKCGHKLGKWYSWIVPTFLEVMLFVFGIIVGVKAL